MFSKIVIGTTVVMALKGYSFKKFKSFKKSADEFEIGKLEGV